MERREFLRKGLALGVAGLLPGAGLMASDCLSLVSETPLEPIWDAAVNGRWDIVKQWLKRDPSLIGITGSATIRDCPSNESTLLHLASALNPNVDFLKYLVSLGADINAQSESGATPLHSAAWNNSNVEILVLLILYSFYILCVHFFYF